jgi:HK97 family phage major capsid protein
MKIRVLYALIVAFLLSYVVTFATGIPAIGLIAFTGLMVSSYKLKHVIGEGIVTLESKSDHEEKLIQKFDERADKIFKRYEQGLISHEALEIRLKKLADDASKMSNEEIKKFAKEVDAIREQSEEIGKAVKEMKISFAPKAKETYIRELVNSAVNSDTFKRWVDEGASGRSPVFTLNRDISLGSNYSGTVLITKDSGVIIDAPIRMSHVRQIVPNTISELPNIVGTEVYNWSDNGNVVAENGTITASTFDVREITWNVKRLLAKTPPLSIRMLKSLKWLQQHLESVLPNRLLMVEDYQMLIGDGAGNNLKGMLNDLSSYTLVGPSGAGTSIASIATYNAGTQTLVTFLADHGLKPGYKITFASTGSGLYDHTYDVQVLTAKTIVVNRAYSAQSSAAWTWTSYHTAYQTVQNPNVYDCILYAISLARTGEFSVNAGIINPAVTTELMTLKDADDQYINKFNNITRQNGILTIDGIPFVETTAMPIDKFIVGQFTSDVLELAQFSPLTIQFATDVSYIEKNQMVVFISEEVIFPIYNKYVIKQGSFTTLKAQLLATT